MILVSHVLQESYVQHGANEGNNNNLAVAEIVLALSPRPRNLHILWQEYWFRGEEASKAVYSHREGTSQIQVL